MNKRHTLALLAVLALAVLVGAPLLGMGTMPLSVIWQPGADTMEAEVFWRLRLPRVLLAFLAGAGLALGGMSFQALFRNALATPFTLGVASGASLGAALYVRLGLLSGSSGALFFLLERLGVSLFALLGALLAIGLVYGLSRARRGFSTSTMLLAGVAISFFFSSLILFIQYTSDFFNSFRILRWLMGGLSGADYWGALSVLVFTCAGGLVLLYLSRELDLLTTGEEIATSRGVNVNRIKMLLFLAVSLMVGGIVAVCGPIGFVGLMCPHICRLMVGPDHRYLMPATLLFGGVFLTLCDALTRVLFAPTEMPVGVLTAFLGGPFFLWLLLRGASEKSIL